MQFCPKCSSYVKKEVVDNKIKMVCHCGFELDVKPSSTTMGSYELETTNDLTKYSDYIKNSCSDLSATRITRTCKKCSRTYMNMLNITENNIIVYTCVCGAVELN